MEFQQLKIDIKTDDGITIKMYERICKAIHDEGGEVLDDGHAPYTEDMSDEYHPLEVAKREQEEKKLQEEWDACAARFYDKHSRGRD